MNVLEKIVADKKQEIEQRKETMPQFAFESGLTPSRRSFYEAIKKDKNKNGKGFILEVKKASPSKGLIRADFDLEEICHAYKPFASCVSVLTDEKYFQGDFERLPKVKELMHQPILCKDFFIDPYQVYLARFYGADAILLMLSVLNDQEYIALATIANSLQLDILTEVSNEEEMLRAIDLKATIIGINNRNLRDLSTDLNQSVALHDVYLKNTDAAQQGNTLLISESGIYTHQQVNQLSRIVDGFLVGSSLMAEENITKACERLVFGEHKVCGLTSVDDVNKAKIAGASFLGLIFVDGSKRQVTLAQAKKLIEASRAIEEDATEEDNEPLKFVAVVQDLALQDILSLAHELGPYAIQLHGNEDASYISELKGALSNIQIWKAISVGHGDQLPNSWPDVDRIILDTKSATGASGGTGEAFNWNVLRPLHNNFEAPTIMLAGGLSMNNINAALDLPVSGLDLNSGVESSPGVKSAEKLTEIFNIIRRRTTTIEEQHEIE